ncbi:phage repressor protein CI [Pectobacterium versatile]|uniref:phage repressor protein CI n=1 Tax=Pectobacterium versatile TaxID=2488639 RepID=UPI00200AAFCB|nr:phage repressor protein CI [Pectobacterium versatile]
MNLESGGRAAIDRLIEAYGFGTRQQLCEHLGVSKSTMANRYLRDSFPSDFVVRCALETGASLRWLATGEGPMYEDGKTDVVSIPRKRLLNGELHDSNYYMFDKAFLPYGLQDPIVIIDGDATYITDRKFDEVTDGKWLVEIEGKTSVRDLTRIPVGKVRVSGVGIAFDCGIDEIGVISKIIMNCSRV